MSCPFCGSPDVQQIGRGLYVCLDCGEQFGGWGCNSQGLGLMRRVYMAENTGRKNVKSLNFAHSKKIGKFAS